MLYKIKIPISTDVLLIVDDKRLNSFLFTPLWSLYLQYCSQSLVRQLYESHIKWQCVCVSGETEAHELLCSNNIFSSQKETRFSAWDPPVETCSDQDVARAA